MEIQIPDLPEETNLFPTQQSSQPSFGHARTSSANSLRSNYPYPQSHSRTRSSQSEQAPPPVQSHEVPLELALYVLLDDFFARADAKMTTLLRNDQNVHLPLILGEDVDPSFDASLKCLADASKHLPKLSVDLIMRWRKSHSQNTRGNSERRSLASIHILCRALIAIVGVMSDETLQGDLGAKLEDIVFNSFKNAHPVHVNRSIDRRSNVRLYSILLSLLARSRFISVSDRFLTYMKPILKGTMSRESSNSLILRINAVSHLPLAIYPLEEFEKSAEFMEELAKIFENVSGAPLKLAFADAICALLVKVGRSATAEVNHPVWRRIVETIFLRAQSMVAKPRYSGQAVPLLAVTLSAAPQDILLARWQSAVDPCLSRIKDKDQTMRHFAAHSLMMILHAYLRRSHEPPAATARRLEPIVRACTPQLAIPQGPSSLSSTAVPTLASVRKDRQQIESADAAVAIAVPHLITLRHFSHGAEIINSLISVSSATPRTEEQLSSSFQPVRFIAGLSALVTTLDSLEFRRGDPILPKPAFLDPDVEFEDQSWQARDKDDRKSQYICGGVSDDVLRRNGVSNLIKDGQKVIVRALQAIDRTFSGTIDMFDERNLASRLPDLSSPSNAASQDAQQSLQNPSSYIYKPNGQFTVSYPRSRQPYFDVMALCFQTWPRMFIIGDNDVDLLNVDTPSKADPDVESLIKILLQSVTHVDPSVAAAARNAVLRMVSPESCPHLFLAVRLVQSLSQIIVSPAFAFSDNATYQTAASAEVEKLTQFWEEVVTRFCTLLSTPASTSNAKLPANTTDVRDQASSNGNASSAAGAANAAQKRTRGGLAPGFVFGGQTGNYAAHNGNGGIDGAAEGGLGHNELGQKADSASHRSRNVSDELDEDLVRQVLHFFETHAVVMLCHRAPGVRRSALAVLFQTDSVYQRSQTQHLQRKTEGTSVIRIIGSFDNALNCIAQEDQLHGQGSYASWTPSFTSCSWQRNTQTRLTSKLNGAERARLNMYRKPSLSKRHAKSSYNPKDDEMGWGTALTGSTASASGAGEVTRGTGPNRELLELIRSDNLADYSLWQRILPWMFRRVLNNIPEIAHSARPIIERTVSRLYTPATLLAGINSKPRLTPHKVQQSYSIPDSLVVSEHWRSYITALCGIANAELCSHMETSLVPLATKAAETDANYPFFSHGMKELFSLTISFIGSENPPLRDAVISGLSSVHPDLYSSLIEQMDITLRQLAEEKAILVQERERETRSAGTLSASTTRRLVKSGRFHASIARVLDFSSCLLLEMPPDEGHSHDIRTSTFYTTHVSLFNYLKESYATLGDPTLNKQSADSNSSGSSLFDDSTMNAWKRSFCNLIAAFVVSVERHSDLGGLSNWFPTEHVHTIFTTLDSWCFRPMPVLPTHGGGTSSVTTVSSATDGSRRPLPDLRRHRKPSSAVKQSSSSISSLTNGSDVTFEVFFPAARAMATFCEYNAVIVGKGNRQQGVTENAIDLHSILRWSQILLECNGHVAHECASGGMRRLIKNNVTHAPFLEGITAQAFGEPDSLTLSQSTFGLLSPFLLSKELPIISTHVVLSLSIWKLAHSDPSTRQRALELLASCSNVDSNADNQILSSIASVNLLNSEQKSDFQRQINEAFTAIHSSYTGISTSQHLRLSSLSSNHFVTLSRNVVSDLTYRFVQLGSRHARQLLLLIPRWLSNLTLVSDHEDDPVIINLFILTAKYGDACHREIVRCWRSLVAPYSDSDDYPPSKVCVDYESNMKLLLEWLVRETARRGSRDFIRHAQRVILSLTEAGSGVAEDILILLAGYITPSGMLNSTESSNALDQLSEANGVSSSPTAASGDKPSSRRTTLDKNFSILPRRSALSTSQASLLLSVEALITRLGVLLHADRTNNHSSCSAVITVYLHSLLLHVDHHTALIRSLARENLVRLVRVLQNLSEWCQRGGYGEIPENAFLEKGDSQWLESAPAPWYEFWEHEEPSILSSSRESGRAPSCMPSLVEDCLTALSNLGENLCQEWLKVSLNWAILCPIRHLACRSFQVVRLLKTLPEDKRALAEITMRLSNTISDVTPDAQLFAREILFTLSEVVQASELEEMVSSPQLLWTLVAALESDNKLEFLEAVETVTRVLLKLEEASSRQSSLYNHAYNVYISHRPSNVRDTHRFLWHVQLYGLRSSATDSSTWAFIRTLSSCASTSGSLLVDDSSIVHCAYSSCLPLCLNAFSNYDGSLVADAELEKFASDVALRAENVGKTGIAHVMRSLSKGRFRSKDDFIRQSVANIKEYFSEDEQVKFMVFLLGLLLNPRRWLRSCSLSLLKAFLRIVNFSDQDLISALGGDLMSPLLRLLSTDLATEALSVLQEKFPALPAGSTSHSAELQSVSSRPGTASSVASGAVGSFSRQRTATATDENVVSETLTFGDVEPGGWCTPVPQTGEEITRKSLREIIDTFEKEDGPTHSSSPPVEFATEDYPFPQFDVQSAELKVQSGAEADQSNLGDLVSQLHDLGDFFEKDTMQTSSAFRMSQMIGSASRVAAVLSRSLKHSSSVDGVKRSMSYTRNNRMMGSGNGADAVSSSEALNHHSTLATVDEFEQESSSMEGEWADEGSHGRASQESNSDPNKLSGIPTGSDSGHDHDPYARNHIPSSSEDPRLKYKRGGYRNINNNSEFTQETKQPPLSLRQRRDNWNYRALSPPFQQSSQEGETSDIDEMYMLEPTSPSPTTSHFKSPFFRRRRSHDSQRDRDVESTPRG